MAEYRSGNFQAAEDALKTSAKLSLARGEVLGIASLYRAMSLFKMGRQEEARVILNATGAKLKPLPAAGKIPLTDGESDEDYLIYWLTLKEAQALRPCARQVAPSPEVHPARRVTILQNFFEGFGAPTSHERLKGHYAMKTPSPLRTLLLSLSLLLCAWRGTGTAHAAPGAVVAWGLNDYGQTTVPVVARSGVTAIAAGGRHTVALKNDGSVVAWREAFQGIYAPPPIQGCFSLSGLFSRRSTLSSHT
jgi:hypothetical protein